jgi:uncharacterized protein (TIGR02246 family)
MGADEEAIRAMHERWIAAVNAADLDCLMALMTDDAVLLNPGQTLVSKQSFPAVFSGGHRQFRLHCSSVIEELVIAGDFAHSRCRDALTAIPHGGGETLQLAGFRLTVYRRQGDGRWLLARDAHTLMPVAA